MWFGSPPKLALAVAGTAFVLSRVGDWHRMVEAAAPVTFAEHGSCADPLKVTLAGHDTVVVESAFSIVNVVESPLDVWLASPPKPALAVAVPAFVLLSS